MSVGASFFSRTYSWMSQAAYLDFAAVARGTSTFASKLTTNDGFADDSRFANSQATAFTDPYVGFGLISQLPNTPNGTSLTVFKSNAPDDGSYTIAVRGTEPTAGFMADLLQDFLGVVLAGRAKTQVIEAFRYYKQVTTPGGQAVAYTAAEKAALVNLLLSGIPNIGKFESGGAAVAFLGALTSNDVGLGAPGQSLIPAGASINFTGHSLGGHVAVLLAELVNATAGSGRSVGDVVSFNAPGENALKFEVLNWLGIRTSTQRGGIGSRHLAIYAEGGLNVTAGLGQVNGTRQPVFIESAGSEPGSISVENHSIVRLSDALAVYDLFSRLDPRLDFSSVNGILRAGALNMGSSLEAALDALRKAFIDMDVLPTRSVGADEDRNAFYANVAGLLATQEFESLSGTNAIGGRIVSLARVDPQQLVRQARSDFGAFFALYSLSPFVIANADSVYRASQAALFAQWTRDIAGEPDDSLRAFGSAWVADRARMLAWKNLEFDSDGRLPLRSSSLEAWRFRDEAADVSIVVQGMQIVGTPVNQVWFGSASSDQSDGLLGSDRMYGGGGDDNLSGGFGNDYLEGGDGDDRLDGGDDDDFVHGGAGDDLLSGGTGINILKGGAGFDTYVVAAGQGLQTIVDADGLGRIVLDGAVVTGGAWVGGNRYADADENGVFGFVGNLATGGTLTIDRNIVVEGFRNGDLGIDLAVESGESDPPDIAHTYLQQALPVDDPGNESLYGGSELNDRFQVALLAVQNNGTLILGGSGGSFWGRGGDDAFEGARYYEDRFSGGAGDDDIDGGAHDGYAGSQPAMFEADFLNGDAGSDTIRGGGGDDEIYGDFASLNASAMGASAASFDLGGFHYSLNEQPGSWQHLQGMGVALQSSPTVAAALAYVLGVPAGSVPGYDDDISGGDGDDAIVAGNGSDVVDGGAGNDLIEGDYALYTHMIYLPGFGEFASLLGKPGDDVLDGGGGDDIINDAVGGSDSLGGDDGDDTLFNRERAEYCVPAGETVSFSNVLDGGRGNDTIKSFNDTIGFDEISGGEGRDDIYFEGGKVFIDGGDGSDVIVAIAWGDIDARGGDGDDEISVDGGYDNLALVTVDGGSGDDRIIALGGSARVRGGAGNDRYEIGGSAVIDQDGGAEADVDRLVLTNALSATVSVVRDGEDLVLETGMQPVLQPDGAAGPAITLANWFAEPARRIDYVEFADGTAWTAGDLDARLQTERSRNGTSGNDVLTGAVWDEIIRAGAGDDTISSRGGSDLIEAGDGDDTVASSGMAGFLSGGKGRDSIAALSDADVVAFNRGDGADVLWLVGGGVISLGGIAAAELTFRQDDTGIILDAGHGDQIAVAFTDLQAVLLPGETSWMLQTISEPAIRQFDLGAAVRQYFDMLAQTTEPLAWSPAEAWEGFSIATSADQALGGQLAYAYATAGTTELLSDEDALEILGSFSFGRAPQSVIPAQAPNELAFALASGGPAVHLADGIDTVRFGAGITPAMLSMQIDPASILIGNSGDAIRLVQFDPSDVFGSVALQGFIFADGSSLAFSELLRNGFELSGADGDDWIAGTNTRDRIAGGRGADTLAGGAGDDDYRVDADAGSDLIRDIDGTEDNLDTVVFGAGIAPDALSIRLQDGMLSMTPVGTTDTLSIEWNPSAGAAIERVRFADGTVWSQADLLSRVQPLQAVPHTTVGDVAAVVSDPKVGQEVLLSESGEAGDKSVTASAGDAVEAVGQPSVPDDQGASVQDVAAPEGIEDAEQGATTTTSSPVAFDAVEAPDIPIYFPINDATALDVLPEVGSDENAAIAFGTPGESLLRGRGDAGEPLASRRDKDQALETLPEKSPLKNWYDSRSAIPALQSMLDAGDADEPIFETSSERQTEPAADFAGPVVVRGVAGGESSALTSWEITNALLEFHLAGRLDEAAGADLPGWQGGRNALAGIAPGFSALPGMATIGQDAQQMQTFSGLQEGFDRLG